MQGIKCGMGHMELCNGAIYDGQFQKGLPNGVGVMKFTDGSKYEGEFMQVRNKKSLGAKTHWEGM